MRHNSACWIYTTAPDPSAASLLAKTIVGQKLAACANIIPAIQSVYWWEGKLCEEGESAVVFKTTQDLFAKVSDTIKKHHPYSVPCIVAIPWSDVDAAYLQWMNENISVITE